MTLIRFRNAFGTFLLRDPEPLESAHFGTCFTSYYKVEGERGTWQRGQFPLRSATLIEPVPEQQTMKVAA